MLEITIPEAEYFNEELNEFISIKEQKLRLEHSLVSISKWESKWKKPFMSEKTKRTKEEVLDYFRCMTINKDVNPLVYEYMPIEIFDQINAYIQDPQTATWISDIEGENGSREIITSELIYYWMIEANIPLECERWHLNRLITLIRIFSIKKGPQKKMSKGEIMARNRMLNEQRRAKMKTKG